MSNSLVVENVVVDDPTYLPADESRIFWMELSEGVGPHDSDGAVAEFL